MSNTIPVDTLPQAVIGAQVSISRDEMRELRSKGTLNEEVDKRLLGYMGAAVMQKHKDDVEITPIDAALSTSGRAYRLEILTFSRRQWMAHAAEWDALIAERDALGYSLQISPQHQSAIDAANAAEQRNRELTRQVEQLMAALTQIVEHRTAMGGLSGRRMQEIAKAALADAVDYADDIIKARDRPALAAPSSSSDSGRADTGREER